MKIAVVGAGLVGITSAYELASDGHEVTVFERRGSLAAESSFANAGVVAPAAIIPWALPDRHQRLRSASIPSPALLAWRWRWRRAGGSRAQTAPVRQLHRLGDFSRARLRRLTRDLRLEHERSDGCLLLLRDAAELAAAERRLAAIEGAAPRVERLDPNGCRIVEPGIDRGASLHCGLYLPDSEATNGREFGMLLRSEAQRLGARFLVHTEVRAVSGGSPPEVVHEHRAPDTPTAFMRGATELDDRHASSDTEPPAGPIREHFDAIVICAATGAVRLLRRSGVALPMRPVYGYSITAPLRRHDGFDENGPRAALVDLKNGALITRLGTRVRVAGGAELGGTPHEHDSSTVESLYKVLNEWFPASARLDQSQVWKGGRPTLPDGLPVLGASGLAGVWLNLAHGGIGWSLACGCARVVADAIAQREPAFEWGGLGIERWKR